MLEIKVRINWNNGFVIYFLFFINRILFRRR